MQHWQNTAQSFFEAKKSLSLTQSLGYTTTGLILTATLFAVGLFPAFYEKPSKPTGSINYSDLVPITETISDMVTEHSTVESIEKLEVPTPPKVTAEAMIEVPNLPIDFTAMTAIDVGMSGPVMPGMTAGAIGNSSPIFDMADLDEVPSPFFTPAPAYPMAARQRRLEGEVRVRLLLDQQGRVVKAELIDGPMNKIFGATTLKTVRSWRFKAARKNGQDVMCRVEIPVVFTLGAK